MKNVFKFKALFIFSIAVFLSQTHAVATQQTHNSSSNSGYKWGIFAAATAVGCGAAYWAYSKFYSKKKTGAQASLIKAVTFQEKCSLQEAQQALEQGQDANTLIDVDNLAEKAPLKKVSQLWVARKAALPKSQKFPFLAFPISRGNFPMVETLLKHNANPNISLDEAPAITLFREGLEENQYGDKSAQVEMCVSKRFADTESPLLIYAALMQSRWPENQERAKITKQLLRSGARFSSWLMPLFYGPKLQFNMHPCVKKTFDEHAQEEQVAKPIREMQIFPRGVDAIIAEYATEELTTGYEKGGQRQIQ